jgi:hypothetical protein
MIGIYCNINSLSIACNGFVVFVDKVFLLTVFFGFVLHLTSLCGGGNIARLEKQQGSG